MSDFRRKINVFLKKAPPPPRNAQKKTIKKGTAGLFHFFLTLSKEL